MADDHAATGEPSAGAVWAQVFVTSLSLFNFGYNTASISGALLYIDLANVDCRSEAVCLTTAFAKGYVVSSCLLGALLGAFLAGSLADRLGRRTTLLANNVFYFVGPVGMFFAPSAEFLAYARLVTGIGVGVASALVHVYISEIVPASRRGEHGALLVMMGTGGILVANLMAYWLGEHWRWVLGASAVTAFLQAALGPCIMPESADWLEAHRQVQLSPRRTHVPVGGAARSLQPPSREPGDGAWRNLWQAVRSGQAKKPLIIGVGLQVLQQISGINVAIYYAPKIFTLAHFSNSLSVFLSAAVSGAQIAATLLLARTIDRVGRRPMSFIGLGLMILSLSLLGASFLLSGKGEGWLALCAVFLYRVSFSISLGPLPYIITAEIFPQSFRASGVSLCWAANWGANFLVSLTFLPLLGVLTISGTFFMYAAVCCFAVYFVHERVPETRGRTLQELEGALAGNSSRVSVAPAPEFLQDNPQIVTANPACQL